MKLRFIARAAGRMIEAERQKRIEAERRVEELELDIENAEWVIEVVRQARDRYAQMYEGVSQTNQYLISGQIMAYPKDVCECGGEKL